MPLSGSNARPLDLPAVTLTDSVTTPSIRVRCVSCGRSFTAFRRSAKTCSPACRQRYCRALQAVTPPLPSGLFDLIYADPPWDFVTYSAKGQGRSPSRHYQTMNFGSICRLPIEEIAAPDAGLALWVYGPMLPQALVLIERWGFTYKSDLLIWVKTTSTGKLAFGTGYTTRKNAEQMLYATRGRGLKVVDRGVRQSILSERREHSRKPDEAAEALERLFGPVRRIELFARERRPGWSSWGQELPDCESAPSSDPGDANPIEGLACRSASGPYAGTHRLGAET
jgi:N6-adenosine-specific RNA methylase IME4